MDARINRTSHVYAYFKSHGLSRYKIMPRGIYEKYVLPRVINFVCGLRPMRKQRQKTVPLAEGRVLEIGIGSGLNLPYYDPGKVERVWGLDPSAEMWKLAKKNLKAVELNVEFIKSDAEEIPLDDNSADTVLVTYALCTIPNVPQALSEIRRVIRPNGRLLFCEHGAAPDEAVRAWQDRLNPLWKKVGGGCNLNRRIPLMLKRAGFAIPKMETSYIAGWKPASFNYRGTATLI